MNKNPLVSIIIVNWNGGKVFVECLKSLSEIDYQDFELIIIDNGSTDGSDRMPQKFNFLSGRCQLIRNKGNVGFAIANNQGLEKSKGKYLLLLNNDTKVEPEFITKLVGRIEKDGSLGVIQPKILLMDKPGYLDNAGSFFTKLGFLYHWGFLQKDGPEFGKEREIFSAKGACMIIRRSIIEKIGLFDNEFVSYFEESDFCWRVWLSGYKVLFYPKAVIYHKVGYTIKKLKVGDINYHYYKNRVCSLIKNLGNNNLIPVLVLHIIASLGIMLVYLVRQHPKNTFMVGKALFWNLQNLPKTLKKREIIQRMRIRSDKELFAILSRPVNLRKHFEDFKRVEKDIKLIKYE